MCMSNEGKTDSQRDRRARRSVSKADVEAGKIILQAKSGRFSTSSERKTERLTARLTPDQDALIRYAAEITGTDLTNFTITTLVARAADILADRKLFILDDAAWTEFNAMLDAPVSHKPRLEKLFSEPTIFDTRPES
jgi:uncharacterized protein (DUF1778 family)